MAENIIPAGTQVRVSDGALQPPARFSKKLREWARSNFDGVVTSFDERRGSYTVQSGDWSSKVVVFKHGGIPPSMITPIPGRPVLPVTGGFCPTVDSDAALKLLAELSAKAAA